MNGKQLTKIIVDHLATIPPADPEAFARQTAAYEAGRIKAVADIMAKIWGAEEDLTSTEWTAAERRAISQDLTRWRAELSEFNRLNPVARKA